MVNMHSDIIERLNWGKSSYSGNNGNCVEIADLPSAGQAVRDSKDPYGPVLVFPVDSWSSFVAAIKDGEFSA